MKLLNGAISTNVVVAIMIRLSLGRLLSCCVFCVSFLSSSLFASLPSTSDLTNQMQLGRVLTASWRVEFNLNCFFSLSNSIATKLNSAAGDSSRKKNLTSQLVKITRGEIPPQLTEIRTGSVVFSDGHLRVEDRLVSMSPTRNDTASVSNKVSIITKENYIKLYSYFGKQNGSILGEAEMRPTGSNTSGLPLPLVPSELIRFIGSLTNVIIDQRVVDGIPCYRLKGNTVAGCMGECEMDFDSEKQMFPFRITLSQCDGMMSEYQIVAKKEMGLGWRPIHAELTFKNGETEIYKQVWSFSNYRIEKSIPSSEFHFDVPKNYVVNEYRFSKPFAYIMGLRPPSGEELKEMSTNRDAILKYQRTSWDATSYVAPISQKKLILTRTVILLIALGGPILLLLRFLKKKNP